MRFLSVIFLALSVLAGCDQLGLGKKPDPAMSGSVESVRPSTEDTLYATVNVTFTNGADRPIRVARAKVKWLGGSTDVRPDVTVGSGESVQFSTRVLPKHGDITALIEGNANPRVEIVETD